jgi:hypothetical protein
VSIPSAMRGRESRQTQCKVRAVLGGDSSIVAMRVVCLSGKLRNERKRAEVRRQSKLDAHKRRSHVQAASL